MKSTTEEYTNKSNRNLGSMDSQVEGLSDRSTSSSQATRSCRIVDLLSIQPLCGRTIIAFIYRMSEVDDNLNYMLSQLSLVVSEFNQVKTGLGQAMEGMEDELLEEFKRQQGSTTPPPS